MKCSSRILQMSRTGKHETTETAGGIPPAVPSGASDLQTGITRHHLTTAGGSSAGGTNSNKALRSNRLHRVDSPKCIVRLPQVLDSFQCSRALPPRSAVAPHRSDRKPEGYITVPRVNARFFARAARAIRASPREGSCTSPRQARMRGKGEFHAQVSPGRGCGRCGVVAGDLPVTDSHMSASKAASCSRRKAMATFSSITPPPRPRHAAGPAGPSDTISTNAFGIDYKTG